MAEIAWIKFSPSDWLTGTRGLSAAETGVYITLVMMMYERGGAIEQTNMLYRQCGTTAAGFSVILSELVASGKILIIEGKLTNGRVELELKSAATRISKAKTAAETRWEKTEENQQNSDANASTEHSDRIATRAGATLHNNTIQEDKRSSLRSDTPAAPKSKGTRLTSDWVLPKSYGDWALERGLPRERILVEADKMRNWSINAGRVGVKVDWFAAWQNWVQKALDDLPRQRGSPNQSTDKPTFEDLARFYDAQAERESAGGEGASPILQDFSKQPHH